MPVPPPHDVQAAALGALREAVAALVPAALGSAVGQAWKPGLSWRQRLVQWVTGICVSYYVTLGLTAWLGWSPFVGQAVGFVLAMMAFEIAPKLVASCSAAVGHIPGYVDQLVARWTGR
ncbi:MAG: hypothetical protein JO290_04230 [Sphingomonadaceae bacterium]|nr:hypothetical protein [Sphingomonadaceae bacterium]